jgi:DNA-binding NarL/FixJ family response regulator
VENHVAAVLMKLDAPSRYAAVSVGRNQGIITIDT